MVKRNLQYCTVRTVQCSLIRFDSNCKQRRRKEQKRRHNIHWREDAKMSEGFNASESNSPLPITNYDLIRQQQKLMKGKFLSKYYQSFANIVAFYTVKFSRNYPSVRHTSILQYYISACINKI